MVHGLGGHCARFEELALRMNEIGGFVFAHDNCKLCKDISCNVCC